MNSVKVAVKSLGPVPRAAHHSCERPKTAANVRIVYIDGLWVFVTRDIVAYTINFCPFCGDELAE